MRHHLFLFILLLVQLPPAVAVPVNQLAGHPSPYLAMHGHDPVMWQLWGPEVLQRAKREGKLIFVSSGYYSCHWCHVMQRESYRDQEIARRINAHFIAVKVDRELEPALDAQLVEFVKMTQGQAGWPLNVFLTPDGYPLLGFTYLPRDRFAALLDQLQRRWQSERQRLSELARQGVEDLRALKASTNTGTAALDDSLTALLESSRLLRDDMSGGFGEQAKFPMTPQLSALLDVHAARRPERLKEFLVLTLDQMAGQGLRDHIGEGFFRYATDPAWQVPHFEKMLYGNAQLSMLYLKAADILEAPRYREIGLATLDFILDNMSAGDGAYVASFSAVDDQGREGYYYLWSDETLKKLLDTEELRAARAYWNMQGVPPFEYGHLPTVKHGRAEVARELDMPLQRLNTLLAGARAKLLKERSRRSLPVDSKRLAGWNGLVLSALAQAYGATGDARYRQAARALADYIGRVFRDGDRLLRAADRGRPLGSAGVGDYALLARGLYDWSQAGDRRAGRPVAGLVRQGWRRFFRDGRWHRNEAPLVASLGGKTALESGPLPSASAVLTALALHHPELKEDKRLQARVRDHLQAVRTRLGAELFWYADYVTLLTGQSLR